MIDREIIDVPELLCMASDIEQPNTSFRWSSEPYVEIDGERLTVSEYNNRIDPESKAKLAEAGRRHWEELHLQENPTKDWFRDWFARIPNFGCSCQRDFIEILTQIRYSDWIDWIPAAADAIEYTDSFEFRVACHNAVNRKLGKSTISDSEAISIWTIDGSTAG